MTPAIIEFPYGLIGIAGTRYALLEGNEPLSLLQSMDDPSLAVQVTNPVRFVETYAVEPSDQEGALLPAEALAHAQTYATVRHDPERAGLVLNLRAPILIVGDHGYQVINQAPDAALRVPIGA